MREEDRGGIDKEGIMKKGRIDGEEKGRDGGRWREMEGDGGRWREMEGGGMVRS